MGRVLCMSFCWPSFGGTGNVACPLHVFHSMSQIGQAHQPTIACPVESTGEGCCRIGACPFSGRCHILRRRHACPVRQVLADQLLANLLESRPTESGILSQSVLGQLVRFPQIGLKVAGFRSREWAKRFLQYVQSDVYRALDGSNSGQFDGVLVGVPK